MTSHLQSGRPDLDRLVRGRFGFDGFREGQREAIETLLAKGRLLLVAPTGGGKSLCYQAPALVREGLIAFAISSAFVVIHADALRSLSPQSKVMRRSGRPLASR